MQLVPLLTRAGNAVNQALIAAILAMIYIILFGFARVILLLYTIRAPTPGWKQPEKIPDAESCASAY